MFKVPTYAFQMFLEKIFWDFIYEWIMKNLNLSLHSELGFWNEAGSKKFVSDNVVVKVEHGFDRFNTKA